jgi:hypothetical protein
MAINKSLVAGVGRVNAVRPTSIIPALIPSQRPVTLMLSQLCSKDSA